MDQRIGLHLVKQVGPLAARLLHLILRGSGSQGLVGGIEGLLKLIDFGLQRNQLLTRLFVLAEFFDGVRNLVCIDLGDHIDMEHHRVVFETSRDLLIENVDDARSIGADLIPADVEVRHDRDALQIKRHLFQCAPFGRFGREADRIFLGVVFPKDMFALGRQRSDLSVGW
jgi:hypothetical protein